MKIVLIIVLAIIVFLAIGRWTKRRKPLSVGPLLTVTKDSKVWPWNWPNWIWIMVAIVVVGLYTIWFWYPKMEPTGYTEWVGTDRSYWPTFWAIILVSGLAGFLWYEKKLKGLAILLMLIIGIFALVGFMKEQTARRPRDSGARAVERRVRGIAEPRRYYGSKDLTVTPDAWSEIVIPQGHGVDFQQWGPVIATVDGKLLKDEKGSLVIIKPGDQGKFPRQAERIALVSANKQNFTVKVLFYR